MTESEEVYAFYNQVGVALGQWAMVEHSLELLSMRCSDTGIGSLGLAIGFRAIENFRSKIDYVDALVQHKHGRNKSLMTRWTELSKRIRTCASQRNELVHRQPVVIGGSKSGKRIGLFESGWFERAMTKDRSFNEAITIKDVAYSALTFHQLWIEIQNFEMGLVASKERLSAFPVPQIRRPTMRELEAQMRAALGRQPRPSGALPEQKDEQKT